MAEAPAPVHAIRRAMRRIFRKFESERQDGPDRFTAAWELEIEVVPDDLDGGWIARCVDLPGCVSQGETELEAVENLGDALGGVVAARLAQQLQSDPPGSQPGQHRHRIALSV